MLPILEEQSLGAARVLPNALRTAKLRVRLPRFQIEMLQYLRARRPTVRGILSREQRQGVNELDGMASANAEELSAALPGFAEAMT